MHRHSDAIAAITVWLARSTRSIDVPRTNSDAQRVRTMLPDGVSRR